MAHPDSRPEDQRQHHATDALIALARLLARQAVMEAMRVDAEEAKSASPAKADTRK